MMRAPTPIPLGKEPLPVFVRPRKEAVHRPAPNNEKTRARFATLNEFVDRTMQSVSGAGLKVWLILYRDTKPDGLARTAQTDMARRAGIDERTVRRQLQKLVEAGLVEVVHRGGLSRGPSTYRVHDNGSKKEGLDVRLEPDIPVLLSRAPRPCIP